MSSAQHDPSLQDLLGVLQNRKKLLYQVVACCLAIAILLCLFKTRRYQASSTIELQKAMSDSLGLDSMMGGGAGVASDSLSANVDIQTQSSILQSDQIALNVIRDLKLENNSDFRPRFNPLGFIIGLVSPKGPADPPNASLDDAPRRRENALRVFSANLKVKAVAGTRLIEVDYSNPDPTVAAQVVNDLTRQLIDYSFRVRFKATTEASKWLEIQLGDLRNQSTDLQQKLVAVQKDTGLFGVGGTDAQGKSTVYSPVLDRLQVATNTLAQAQSNRILKGAVYEAVKSGDAELISQLSGTATGVGAGPGVTNSLTLIQTLRGQEASLQSEIEQNAVKFGPAYPKLIELRASVARIRQSLQEEIERIRSRARNDFEIATQTEAGAKANYETTRKEAEKLNDKTIEYTILQRESNQSQDLYQDLLKRLKEAGVVEGLHSSNLTVVDMGRVPSRPATPNVPLYLLLGLGAGLVLGTATVYVMQALDRSVQSPKDAEDMGLLTVGLIPKVTPAARASRIELIEFPESGYSEALRRIRNSLFTFPIGSSAKVVLVTSGKRGEGKTSFSINLAITLGDSGKKVVLVEADLRQPTFSSKLNLNGSVGLLQVLSKHEEAVPTVLLPKTNNVFVLCAGGSAAHPADLLAAGGLEKLLTKLKQQFDFVVIDSPAALPVTDVQPIAAQADIILLVTRFGVTSKAALLRTYHLLSAGAPPPGNAAFGVIINAVPTSSPLYREYYGDQQREYRSEDNSLENA